VTIEGQQLADVTNTDTVRVAAVVDGTRVVVVMVVVVVVTLF
jgi:hypothetical protein